MNSTDPKWRRITVSLPAWQVERIDERMAKERRPTRSNMVAVLIERALLADEPLGTVTVSDKALNTPGE